jgi:outer membrane biosynthesis protein TonB
VHLRQDGWRLRVDGEEHTLSGTPLERVRALAEKLERSEVFGVSAEPDVAIADVLRALSTNESRGRLELHDTSSKPQAPNREADSEMTGLFDSEIFPTARVTGRLSHDAVRSIMDQNSGRFRSCYAASAANDPSPREGYVNLSFVIHRDGSVDRVRAVALDDPALARCIEKTARSLSFPRPEQGIVTVDWPLVFRP